MDGKVESLSKLAKSLDRTRNEQRELMAEHVTRYELEQLRDKMTVVTQQSVAASLSAWHDKMEQSVRNVERQVLFSYEQIGQNIRTSLGMLCVTHYSHPLCAFYRLDCVAPYWNDRP